jgi:hypothetical protein
MREKENTKACAYVYILYSCRHCPLPQSTMAPYIRRPLPLITARIEFELESPPALPTITPRMEFTPEHLSLRRGREGVPITNRHLQCDNQLPTQRRHEQESPLMVHSLGERSTQPAEESDSGLFDLSEPNADLSDPEGPPLPRLRRPEASNKIPKPPGEPGRPASGGFSLEDTLMKSHDWSKENLERLTVGAHLKPRRWPTFFTLFRRLCVQKRGRVST